MRALLLRADLAAINLGAACQSYELRRELAAAEHDRQLLTERLALEGARVLERERVGARPTAFVFVSLACVVDREEVDELVVRIVAEYVRFRRRAVGAFFDAGARDGPCGLDDLAVELKIERLRGVSGLNDLHFAAPRSHEYEELLHFGRRRRIGAECGARRQSERRERSRLVSRGSSHRRAPVQGMSGNAAAAPARARSRDWITRTAARVIAAAAER